MLELAREWVFADEQVSCSSLEMEADKVLSRVVNKSKTSILAWQCRSPLQNIVWLRVAEKLGFPAMPVRFELERELAVLDRYQTVERLEGAALVEAAHLDRALLGCHYLNMSSGTSMSRTIGFPRSEHLEANARSCVEFYGLGADKWYWCTFPFYAHAHEIYSKSIFSGTPVLAFPSSAIATINRLLKGACKGLHILTTPHVALSFLSRHLTPVDPATIRFELAGEYVSMGVVNRLRRMGFEVAISWGSAETSGVAVADLDPQVPFSIGNPLPGYNVSVGDGLLTVEGSAIPPYLFESHHLMPTRGRFQSSDAVEWDGQRWLFRGRTDRQIKYRGTYILSGEVEGWAKQFDVVDNAFLLVNEWNDETRLELRVQCPDRTSWPEVEAAIKAEMYRIYGGIKLHVVLAEELAHTPFGKLIRRS